ncbi:MAG: hypothetical protein Q7U01_05315 [Pseudomonas sp.]|nr:hypothetical protein [Pseudomonas sp.]
MKTQYMLTPLAMALAALVSASTFASDNGNNGGPGQGYNQDGGSASIHDHQLSEGNKVLNEGTENDASIDGSLGAASGNIGVNVAAGDNNQQANAAALATADAGFVFGSAAKASIEVGQVGTHNSVHNYSTQNTAQLTNSANGSTGNIGINVASGVYNQQKNDMVAAVSEKAYSASANVGISQKLSGNTTENNATLDYGTAAVSLKLTAGGTYVGAGVGGYSGTHSGTSSGTSDQIGNVYLDSWSGSSHPGGVSTGHVDLDDQVQGAVDLNDDGGALAFNNDGTYSGTQSGTVGIVEAGLTTLAGTVSGNIPVVAGFKAPVINDAKVNGSLNNVSGNLGLNIAAGSGNQQSNSLAIAAGCTACSSGL